MRTWAFRSVILNLIDTCKSKKIKISYLRMARHTVLRKKQRWLAGFSKSIFFVNINRWNKCNYLSKTGFITICLQTHLSPKIWAKMLKNCGFPGNHFYLYQIFYLYKPLYQVSSQDDVHFKNCEGVDIFVPKPKWRATRTPAKIELILQML